MIGVVLWSDPAEQKAVFWCEDQGDLAYYTSAPDEEDHQGLFYAGDMVQFDVSVERNYRKARNPRLIQESACTGLPSSLRDTADATHRTASRQVPTNVVPLPTRARDGVRARATAGT